MCRGAAVSHKPTSNLLMESLLQEFRAKAGGIFETVFDEAKARDVVLRLGLFVVREEAGTCDCHDPNCPHKGRINPLASVFLIRALQACLKPTKTPAVINFEAHVPRLFDRKKQLFEQLPETESASCYYRWRMAHHWVNTETKVLEPLNRCVLDVVEGVELPENHQIKKVCYVFNENPVSVKVEKGHRFIRCPFPIFLHYLVYCQVDIKFEGPTDNFEFFVIGGTVPDYPHVEMPDVTLLYNEKKRARYQGNTVGFW